MVFSKNMRPADYIFGPCGALSVTFDEDSSTVLCRNGIDNVYTTFQATITQGRQIEAWLMSGKKGLIQEMCPDLNVDQREQCMSGLTSNDYAMIEASLKDDEEGYQY